MVEAMGKIHDIQLNVVDFNRFMKFFFKVVEIMIVLIIVMMMTSMLEVIILINIFIYLCWIIDCYNFFCREMPLEKQINVSFLIIHTHLLTHKHTHTNPHTDKLQHRHTSRDTRSRTDSSFDAARVGQSLRIVSVIISTF